MLLCQNWHSSATDPADLVSTDFSCDDVQPLASRAISGCPAVEAFELLEHQPSCALGVCGQTATTIPGTSKLAGDSKALHLLSLTCLTVQGLRPIISCLGCASELFPRIFLWSSDG
jgi:hypothetical protein